MKLMLGIGILLLAGCAAQRASVDCEWRLKPINLPAPASQPVQKAVEKTVPATREGKS